MSTSRGGAFEFNRALKELKDKGYLTITKSKNAEGKFIYTWEISEIPLQQRILEEPDIGFPDTGKPTLGKPTTGKPATGNLSIKHIEDNKEYLTLSKEHVVITSSDEEREETIHEIFDYWKRILGDTYSKFSSKKRDIIMARLKDGFTPEQLKKVIDFVQNNSYWKSRTTTIESIFRDLEKVELLLNQMGNKTSSPKMVITDEDRAKVKGTWIRDDNSKPS